MLGGGGGVLGLLSVRPHFCWGGVGAAKGLLPYFLVPKGNQPTACTLALWWLKFGPTGTLWGGGGANCEGGGVTASLGRQCSRNAAKYVLQPWGCFQAGGGGSLCLHIETRALCRGLERAAARSIATAPALVTSSLAPLIVGTTGSPKTPP